MHKQLKGWSFFVTELLLVHFQAHAACFEAEMMTQLKFCTNYMKRLDRIIE